MIMTRPRTDVGQKPAPLWRVILLRRLRRDLHDDLAPKLAAFALTASAAEDIIRTDAERATRIVGQLRASLRASIGDIRRLVYDLRPPTLDELGLVAAVRERAAQYSLRGGDARLDVHVEAPEELPPLPAAVEVAAYRIIQEALMNVTKHAQARRCDIRLAHATRDGRPVLALTVADDGSGLPQPDAAGDLEVVGHARTGEEAVTRAAELEPDVILMDIQMPGIHGIEATRRILAQQPGMKVLIVTMFQDDASVFTAMRAGARGYVLKDAEKEDLLRAIRAVSCGEAIFSPGIAARITDFFTMARPAVPQESFPALSSREREVLHLMAQGSSNAEVARLLSLTGKTVANYVSTILAKLQVADRAEAVLRARQSGLGPG